MKVIKFNEDFKKLDSKEFFTIRLNDKDLKLNETVNIKTPTKEFKAKTTILIYMQLKEVNIQVLCRDLDIDFDYFLSNLSHGHLLEGLRKFYPNLERDDMVYIYNFERCS